MTERQAWFCPSCQKYHAPHVDTCAGTGEGTEAAPWKTFTPLVKPSTHTYPLDVGRIICGIATAGGVQ